MKQTVEAAAKEYYERYKIHLSKDIFRPRIIDVFKSGAEWQSKQFPWISVEDAIPNKQAKGMCQVKYVDGSIDEMAMREVNKWISPYIKTGYVTYWRPIPSFDGTLKQTKMYYNE